MGVLKKRRSGSTVKKSTVDSLSVSLGESSLLSGVRRVVSDTLGINLGESAVLNGVRKAVSDTLGIQLLETSNRVTRFFAKGVSDSLAVTLGEVPLVSGPGILGVQQSSYTITEFNTLNFNIVRGQGDIQRVRVTWTLTISQGSPSQTTGTVTFNDRDSAPKGVSIPFQGVTSNVSGTITLSNPVNLDGGTAPSLGVSSATVNVQNDTTAPGTVTFSASVLSSSSVQLTASGGVDTGSGFKEWAFDRSPNGSTGWVEIQRQVGGSYQDNGLAAGTYFYRARALDNAGNVTTSSTQSVTLVTSSNEALRFFGNGVNYIDRVEIPLTNEAQHVNVGGEEGMTVEFCCSPDVTNTSGGSITSGPQYNAYDGHLLIDRDRYNQPRSYLIAIAAGRVAFSVSSANGSYTLVAAKNLMDGRKHHVACQRVMSTGAMYIMIDGAREAFVASTPATGPISYPNGAVPQPQGTKDPFITIGAEKHDIGSQYPAYRGTFGRLRFFNSVRYTGTTYQIPSLADYSVDDANTRGIYNFLEASGTTCVDSHAGGTDGIMRVGGSPTGPVRTSDNMLEVAAFYDGFESGGLAPARAGVQWGSDASNARGSATVQSGTAYAGTRAMRFRYAATVYAGSGNQSDDASAERRMYMPPSPHLWVGGKIFIPPNYYHRGTDNNKFPFAAWGGGDNAYNDPPTPGMTLNLWPRGNGESDLSVYYFTRPFSAHDWNACPRFIQLGDRGTWLDMFIHFYIAGGPGQNGGCQIWVRRPGGIFQRMVNSNSSQASAGGVLQGSNYLAGQVGYDSSYWLGWANTGFDEQTDFFVDEVALYHSNVLRLT